jgi:hypothetical protein
VDNIAGGHVKKLASEINTGFYDETLNLGQIRLQPAVDEVLQEGLIVRAQDGGGAFVGIGTDDPQYELDVPGTVRADAFIGDGSGLTGVAVTGALNDLSDVVSDYITDHNMFLGSGSGAAIQGGAVNNLALGENTLASSTTGYSNTAVGYNALTSATTGNENAAFGDRALSKITTAGGNTAFGARALENATAGTNTAIGDSALWANTTGNINTAVGYTALKKNTTGSGNVTIGSSAMFENTTGTNNVAIGASSGWLATLTANTIGGGNVAVGASALGSNTTGNNNLGVGVAALVGTTTGSKNVGVGYYAGDNITTGNNNIAIGNNPEVLDPTADNQLDIGNLIYGTALDGTAATVSTGKIGIGFKNPGAKLTVNGDIGIADGSKLYLATNTGSGTPDSAHYIYSSGPGTNQMYFGMYDGNFHFYDTNAGSDVVTITGGKVGIGIATPDVSASLDITSTTKGLLPPRMDDTARDAIASPASGLVIYNTTSNTVEFYNGSTWAAVGSGVGVASDSLDFTEFKDSMTLDAATSITGAGTNGLSITQSGSVPGLKINNTGTGASLLVEDAASTDSSPFMVTASGDVGIGTDAPAQKLDVAGVAQATNYYLANVVAHNYSNGGLIDPADATNSIILQAAGGIRSTSNLLFGDTYNGATPSISGSGTNLILGPSGSPHVYINDSHEVGIGTDTPGSTLDVKGTLRPYLCR